MPRSRESAVSISIASGVLESIFDECDCHDIDETGGRLIGFYQKEANRYDIQLLGVIGPGPHARRSETSFFQDGEYQESIFRSIEESHPNVEHLGNWHTHHVNGFPTLSGGDKATYFKTVNHDKHNTDFFYALLVVRKNVGRDPRYDVKHYFFRRGHDTVYEVPDAHIRLVEAPLLWPHAAESSRYSGSTEQSSQRGAPNLERAKDQEFFSEFYPNMKALFSNSMKALYWKGSLALIDGSEADVVAIEHAADGGSSYSIAGAFGHSVVADVSARYKGRRFRSARHAVLQLEKDLNQTIYRCKKGTAHERHHG